MLSEGKQSSQCFEEEILGLHINLYILTQFQLLTESRDRIGNSKISHVSDMEKLHEVHGSLSGNLESTA